MSAFLQHFGSLVLGILSGFDRLAFRGTLRNLAYARGLQHYLWANRIPYKDFAAHSQAVTGQLEAASLQAAQAAGREIRYLNSAQFRKEDIAREIAARDGISAGPICVLRSVDPCLSFEIRKNAASKRLEIKYRERKCLHLYHYQIHPVFGFMHARIQTWFPFRIYVCLNGREWLARQLDQAGLRYRRYDNCVTWVEDLAQAQTLFDQQLQAHWPSLLADLARQLNPAHDQIFARYPSQYYWSAEQSEWASDVLFHRRAELQDHYPRWVRHAITTYGAADVLRFLGRRVAEGGPVPGTFTGEVLSTLKERPEGVRIKHWLNHNSLKAYDKDSALRVECTIQNPQDFRVYRTSERDPDGPLGWRPLRLGVADLHRRAEVSQKANDRYLEALAAVEAPTPVQQVAEPLCQPAHEPARTRPAESANAPAAPPRRRVRALNPLSAADSRLLEAVGRPEFALNGLRNRDLRGVLYGASSAEAAEERRRGAAVTRLLRLLRGHGLIQKVPRTHRYVVSSAGRVAITALLAARDASVETLTANAA